MPCFLDFIQHGEVMVPVAFWHFFAYFTSILSTSYFVAFTWFGLDIGGSLTKLVYFEPVDIPNEDDENSIMRKTVAIIHKYLAGNTAYGKTGTVDQFMGLVVLVTVFC